MPPATSTVRVAVTQAEPAWLDLAGSVAKTCKLIDDAASNGAQVVAFPECFIPGYPTYIWYVPPPPGEKARGGGGEEADVLSSNLTRTVRRAPGRAPSTSNSRIAT